MTLWRKILNTLSFGRGGSGCHGEELHIKGDGLRRKVGIVISFVGAPFFFLLMSRRRAGWQ